ncbi:hypothetical protein B6F84_10650 [Acidianus manzaensis]|uniref:Uncharacterized protein n=1 Tax=Acidianus manzaensis TaxID=282676 RepID=A0A1W6K1T6_9CREN|nr:hypothetical protein B6F84_10650 [Acidianus manzaensis]
MRKLALLLLAIPMLAIISLASSINIISTPPVSPQAGTYFYLEFQFSPVNGTPQPYAIFVGNSVNNLTEVAEGYTNQNGTGYARVPVINSQIEYIDIVWVNVNYSVIQIFPQTTNTSTTTTSITLNNSQGFSFALPGWVNWIVGALIMLALMGIGYKFMGAGGLAVFGVIGVFLSAYFGLIPFYIIYIFVFIVAILGARILTRQLGGGDEE